MICSFPWYVYFCLIPKNHGVSKLMVWRSQNPAIESQTNPYEGPMVLKEFLRLTLDCICFIKHF